MSNCGEYIYNGEKILGSGPRVVKILNDFARGYPDKKIQIIFNDLNNDKISHLKDVVSDFSNNVFIDYFSEDANQLLKKIKCLIEKNNTHYLLFYDPYDAKINWNVICPFIIVGER